MYFRMKSSSFVEILSECLWQRVFEYNIGIDVIEVNIELRVTLKSTLRLTLH